MDIGILGPLTVTLDGREIAVGAAETVRPARPARAPAERGRPHRDAR